MDADDFGGICAHLLGRATLEAGFTHVGEFHRLHHDRGGALYADPGELFRRAAWPPPLRTPRYRAHPAAGVYTRTAASAVCHLPARQRRFTTDPGALSHACLEASRGGRAALPGAAVGVALLHSLLRGR